MKQQLRQLPLKNVAKPEGPSNYMPVFKENDIVMESDSHTNSDEDILELTQGLQDSPPSSVPFKANPMIIKPIFKDAALFSNKIPNQNLTTITELLPETLASI
jgi:hypothetical protein